MSLLNQTTDKETKMNMNQLAAQSLETASKLTNKPITDKETQEIAFKLACAMVAEELAAR